jgi:hypothetical protein
MGGATAFVDTTTLATRLQGAGYSTALLGKYMNGYPMLGSYVPPGWTVWGATGSGQAACGAGVVRVAADAEMALATARDPEVVEPGDVADFPAWRVQLRRAGYQQLRSEPRDIGVEQPQRAPSRVDQRGGQSRGIAFAGAAGKGKVGSHQRGSPCPRKS